jgi:uncharacterized membrane protein
MGRPAILMRCSAAAWDALGRRLRQNYDWIFAIRAVSYLGKLLIHPEPIAALDELWARATVGPVPEQLVLLAGLAVHGGWLTTAVLTLRSRRGAGLARALPERDSVLELALRAA